MAHGRVWRASAGIVATAALTGCLDRNPDFMEPTLPTASGSGGASMSTGDPTPDPETTSQGTTGSPTGTEGSTSTLGTSDPLTTNPTTNPTTMQLGVCGDGELTPDEECDNGPDNADNAACTSGCTLAKCGDGLIQNYENYDEYCEDLNDDPADGCVECFVPHVCHEVLSRAPGSPTGIYMLQPDAKGPLVPVYCDMTLKGGAWTRVERSPFGDPIGLALFKDFEVNINDPENPRYRMSRAALDVVQQHSNDMWIECGGTDHLWTDSDNLFAGEAMGDSCFNFDKVVYIEAQLGAVKKAPIELCTGFTGVNDGECPGAWRVDESEQMSCGLSLVPWDSEPITVLDSDVFAVDPKVSDPNTDCHKPGAIRSIYLR
ncbi:fibrinogen-like YCDxxxxGGGW domain-containing protein [Nannocystis punicea]|uniref:Fibrinogen-like YCDxxxxGGGW domain-containing protein n=1 Tax=Nannocystis punicea TaxID=2995304 RepID=A0ABY7HF77_9BACT|nr:fibrinogen-like YCDxxxxGGGW domain-containing protein [Nannocystis poenicansa]WAS97788.1 fibrinogen-like YCDxxxxGGGW domain-containing protein [Nannocystis poenicansa]